MVPFPMIFNDVQDTAIVTTAD